MMVIIQNFINNLNSLWLIEMKWEKDRQKQRDSNTTRDIERERGEMREEREERDLHIDNLDIQNMDIFITSYF